MNDKARFQATPTPSATELRLVVDETVLPFRTWALSGHSGADLCERLRLDGVAIDGEDVLLVEDSAIARLTAAEAARLDLPPLTTLRAVIEGSGIMTRPGFSVGLRWTRTTGQNVLGVERVGAWLREAEGWRRLPETLFNVARAVDDYMAAAHVQEGERLHALATLQTALPPAATVGAADGSGMLGTVTIVEADALSLDTMGDGDALQLVPVLHRSGDGAQPLLPDDRQKSFGTKQFHRWPSARSVYTLEGGVYVVIAPPLRLALDVVRKAAAGSPAQRRAFLREPRAAIRAAIGDEADAALVEGLVVETQTWSDRVLGLGLWQKRVLPWIALPPSEWFGGEGGTGAGAQPRALGLQIGDRCIPLTPAAAADLRNRVAEAKANGQLGVTEQTQDGPLEVPATDETLDALAKLERHAGRTDGEPATMREVVLIKPNEFAREIEALVQPRSASPPGEPRNLRTRMMAHQRDGLRWLQHSYAAGSPGVLLADDMGLGKTLQALAFLAWLRDGMNVGHIPKLPLLVVAPTGLLANWCAEHDRHFIQPGLGAPLLAYGKDLAALRRVAPDGGHVLDHAALRSSDWVLTTYETLRDHDRDFGRVRFAAMLMDEAQKVKTPGIRLTDAAKGMNADFRVALTGTPVENRLADLWCIVDGVAAGHLNDLKWFSATYEANPDAEKLAALKATLDRPIGGRPPLLMRRLAREHLADLPPRGADIPLRVEMTGEQLAAYEEAVERGRGEQGAGRVLEALQRLRAVSLHPDPNSADNDHALIAASARLRATLDVLDEVKTRGERALVFLDNLDLMARCAGLLQRRYGLRNAPMTISGKLTGTARQARVERFQEAPEGFDVMLLSPRAGGVGLTLTRANHVIHLARWWNPAVEDQCTCRVLRIGQMLPVKVYLPLAVLPGGRPSFDDNLHALLARKRRLMREALLPPEAGQNELREMLRDSLA